MTEGGSIHIVPAPFWMAKLRMGGILSGGIMRQRKRTIESEAITDR